MLQYDYTACTVVMTTQNNLDFTLAAIWALNRFYPGMSVILTDGGSEPGCYNYMKSLAQEDSKFPNGEPINLSIQLIQIPRACVEDCRNAAAALVTTPFILFMDNDTKVLSESAIPILLDAFSKGEDVVQTGAYGVKVVDWKTRKAYVGTEFTDYMPIEAAPCYFSMHRAEAYRLVGGMPKKWFYDGIPPELWEGMWIPGYSGDFSITKLYAAENLICCTPKQRVPVLHWGQANRHFNKPNALEDWWYRNCKHIRCTPLNDWKKLEDGSSSFDGRDS